MTVQEITKMLPFVRSSSILMSKPHKTQFLKYCKLSDFTSPQATNNMPLKAVREMLKLTTTLGGKFFPNLFALKFFVLLPNMTSLTTS